MSAPEVPIEPTAGAEIEVVFPPLRPPTASDQPELFFALVGAVGTPLREVRLALDHELRGFGYAVREVVKLSAQLHKLEDYEDLRNDDEGEGHIRSHMNAGDEVRESFGNGGALAALAITHVQAMRAAAIEPSDAPEARDDAIDRIQIRPATAYVFDSLKHPDEVDLLRRIYGPLIFVISVYDSEDARLARLQLRLEKSGTPVETSEQVARDLMKRDERGPTRPASKGPDFGQDVRGTFPKADFFVDGGAEIESQVRRFVGILFQDPRVGPERDEYAMALAYVAARRSGDLSRQVGAAIADEDGEVLVAACNEVPKPRGGVWWCGDAGDARDTVRGKDPNAIMGREILQEIFRALHAAECLNADLQGKEADAVADEIGKRKLLDGARVGSLIEFGRVVHAEMNALAHAARRGISVAGASLYCSTFPCHVCARHVLAAGIGEVIYIEPYAKSLAEKLYPDAIKRGATLARTAGASRSSRSARPEAVVFRPFHGVAPERYLEWFHFRGRKDPQGYALGFDAKTARPRVPDAGVAHLFREKQVCANVVECLEARPLLRGTRRPDMAEQSKDEAPTSTR